MAGTTRLELATSAVTVGDSLVGLNGISRIRRQTREVRWQSWALIGLGDKVLFNELFNALRIGTF
jgi:hypothetical protein